MRTRNSLFTDPDNLELENGFADKVLWRYDEKEHFLFIVIDRNIRSLRDGHTGVGKDGDL